MRSQLIKTNRHSHHLIAHGELITSHYTTTTRCAHHLTLFHSSYLIFPCGSRSLLPLCFTPSPWPCVRDVIRNHEPLDVCENKQNELCFAHHFDARSSSDDNLHFTHSTYTYTLRHIHKNAMFHHSGDQFYFPVHLRRIGDALREAQVNDVVPVVGEKSTSSHQPIATVWKDLLDSCEPPSHPTCSAASGSVATQKEPPPQEPHSSSPASQPPCSHPQSR